MVLTPIVLTPESWVRHKEFCANWSLHPTSAPSTVDSSKPGDVTAGTQRGRVRAAPWPSQALGGLDRAQHSQSPERGDGGGGVGEGPFLLEAGCPRVTVRSSRGGSRASTISVSQAPPVPSVLTPGRLGAHLGV